MRYLHPHSSSIQCLVHKDFTLASDTCITNFSTCADGFSLSVWYKGLQGLDRDWEFVSEDSVDPSVIETIASTGDWGGNGWDGGADDE